MVFPRIESLPFRGFSTANQVATPITPHAAEAAPEVPEPTVFVLPTTGGHTGKHGTGPICALAELGAAATKAVAATETRSIFFIIRFLSRSRRTTAAELNLLYHK